MNKTQKLFELIAYVNTKKQFTANDVAKEFHVSIRTAHRYLAELDHMGVPLYTEPGRNGGYRVLPVRTLPPILFSEQEALAIFFAFQSLQYYQSLPFEIDITSASRKLFSSLPKDVKPQIEALKATLIFWHRTREVDTPLLKELIQKAAQKKVIKIQYQSREQLTSRVIYPIGVYSNEGIWYVPGFDYENQEPRLFRADRVMAIEDIEDVKGDYDRTTETLADILNKYQIKTPVPLFVELSERGTLLCKDNPYFETNVKCRAGGSGGFIDTVIDQSDLPFVSHFFMSLGDDATIIEPPEMKDYILSFAKKILDHYH